MTVEGNASNRGTLLTTIAHYSSSHTYRRAISVIFAFLKPKLLSPEMYGLWNILNVIPRYATYSDLGVRSSVRYLVPRHTARGEHRDKERIENTAFYGTLITKLIIMAILLGSIAVAELTVVEKLGILTMTIVVILSWYYEFIMSVMKANQEFSLLTKTNYLISSLRVFGGIVLLLLFNLYGLYANIILSFLLVIIYLRKRYVFTPSHEFDLRLYTSLVRYGFPIMVLNFSVLLIITSDRILISYFLGNTQLGYYGIATMIFAFLMDIPTVTREVIVPRLMQSMDSQSWEDNLDEYFLQPLINTAFYIPFMLGPVFFIFPLVVELILPRYVHGVASAQIICLGAYFLALSYPARVFIVANHWQLQALKVMIPALLANIACSIGLIRLGFGIEGVAVGSSLSYVILAAGLVAFIAVKATPGRERCTSYARAVWWPFFTVCFCLAVLKYASAALDWNVYAEGFLCLAVYSAACLAVVALCRRRYDLLRMNWYYSFLGRLRSFF